MCALVAQFYVILAMKLRPRSMHDGGCIVLVRQWLVNKRLEKNTILDTPKVAIETMVMYDGHANWWVW